MNAISSVQLAHGVAGQPLLASIAAVAAPMIAVAVWVSSWRMLARRGAPPNAWSRAAPWLAAFFLAAAFAALAGRVGTDNAMTAFDRALAQGLGTSLPPAAVRLLAAFTHLGDRAFLTAIGSAVFVALVALRSWRAAAGWVAATLGGGLVNRLLKASFERLRPDHPDWIHATGFSFPSGHASAALAIYGMGCYLLLRIAPPSGRYALALAGTGLVAAIGVSRILLRAHFASDVLAGWCVTSAWLILCVTAMRVAERPHGRLASMSAQ